jgi:hypothetical protein
MADSLQSCRQYVRDMEAELSTTEIVTSTAPLTLLPAVITENDPPAGNRQKKANKANKNQNPMNGVRRSARIAVARSMTVAALDSTANDNEPTEQAQTLMLLAWACATHIDVAGDDGDFEGEQGEKPRLEIQPTSPRGEASRFAVGGTIIERFYECPQRIVAPLELRYLQELEQGVFLRVSDPSQRKVHPDMSKLAQKLKATQRERSTFENLLDDCH